MNSIYLRTDVKKNRYVTTRAIRYKEILVPSGYTTDGLTKGVNKYKPKGMRGGVIHDYNCDHNVVSYKKGREYALEIWKADGVSWFARTRWFQAIRVYDFVLRRK